MESKSGKITRIVLINVLIYIVLIVVIELIFGSWFKEDNADELPIIRSQKIHFDISPLQQEGKDLSTYTRDKYGLRGLFQDPSEIDILTIGGSTVDLRYITDGETWQDITQAKFKEIGKEVVVANAGIEGASTAAHIKKFDLWFPTIPELKPKHVLFYIALNDIFLDGERRKENRVSVIKNRKEGSLKNQIYNNSAVYNLLQSLYGYFRIKN